MSSLTNFYGLNVVTPFPTGAGGSAIQSNFESLVQWSPQSTSSPSSPPTVDDDVTQSYYPFSRWLTVNSPPTSPSQLFICANNAAGAAQWQQVVINPYWGQLNIQQITSPTPLIPLVISGQASNSVPFLQLTNGTIYGAFFIGASNNIQIGSTSDHPVVLFANNETVLELSGGGTQSSLNVSFSGTANILGKVINYATVDTAGNGLAAIVADGRATGQTGAISSLATFTPAADGLFVIQANILVTTATSHAFTMTVTYTDEGNTARTVTVPFMLIASPTTITTSIASTNGAVPHLGIPLTIRCKASTAITAHTTGTFTTVTYNAEVVITQVD